MTLPVQRPRYVSKADSGIAALFRCRRKRCWHWSLEYGEPRRLYFAVQRDPARIDRFAGAVMLGCLSVHARTRSLVGLGMALEHIAMGMQSSTPILVRDDRDVVRWIIYPRPHSASTAGIDDEVQDDDLGEDVLTPDPEFWKMIEQRRNQSTVSLQELRRSLGLPLPGEDPVVRSDGADALDTPGKIPGSQG